MCAGTHATQVGEEVVTNIKQYQRRSARERVGKGMEAVVVDDEDLQCGQSKRFDAH
jgi:hypothetical protein